MSQYLSLSAFAAEVGWRPDDVMTLVTEGRIKAYQLINDETYIPKTELAKVQQMSYTTDFPNAKKEQLIQDEADRLSRAHSRSRIASERAAKHTEAQARRQALALRRANR